MQSHPTHKDYSKVTLPKRLFKYYGFDRSLNEKRLTGEIYLANPFQFNDLMDCQLDVINNASELVSRKENGEQWITSKLRELDFDKDEIPQYINSLIIENNPNTVNEIQRRQLQKTGILCLTPVPNNNLMWGYYANNRGLCIEYDTSRIIHDIVISYINSLEYKFTDFLFNTKDYKRTVNERNKDIPNERINASVNFTKDDARNTKNKFLEDKKEDEILNFMYNIYLKRVHAQKMQYGVNPQTTKATLFYDNQNPTPENKYFKKSIEWRHEKEFRISVSLGGNYILKLPKECIKSVRCGYYMEKEDLITIAYLLYKNGMRNTHLYRMEKDKTKGVKSIRIKMKKLYKEFSKIDALLQGVF